MIGCCLAYIAGKAEQESLQERGTGPGLSVPGHEALPRGRIIRLCTFKGWGLLGDF